MHGWIFIVGALCRLHAGVVDCLVQPVNEIKIEYVMFPRWWEWMLQRTEILSCKTFLLLFALVSFGCACSLKWPVLLLFHQQIEIKSREYSARVWTFRKYLA